MATHRSERSAPRRPRPNDTARREAIAWVGSALRTERMLRKLEGRHRGDLPR